MNAEINSYDPIPQPSQEGEAGFTDFNEILRVILENKWTILALTALFSILATIYFSTLPNIYTATAEVLVEKLAGDQQQVFQHIQTPTYNPDSMSDYFYDYYGTQIAILNSKKITEMVSKQLGGRISGYTLTAKRVNKTGILTISVNHRDPTQAAKIAAAYADIFVRQSQNEQMFVNQQLLNYLPDTSDILNENQTKTLGSIDSVDKKQLADSLMAIATDPEIAQLKAHKMQVESQMNDLLQRYKPEYPAVKEVAEQIRVDDEKIKRRTDTLLSLLKAGLTGQIKVSNVRVLQYPDVPEKPSAPNRPRGILVATFLGFLASVGIVLGVKRMNTRIDSQKDIQALGLTFLGYIPQVKELTKKKKDEVLARQARGVSLVDLLEKDPVLMDAVVNVRTHILFSIPYERSKRIMITSALPNEGKTTIAVMLAISLAALGRKILLIDGDLRRPSIEKYLNLERRQGLSDLLTGPVEKESIIFPIGNTTLSVVTAGSSEALHTPELLSSDRFRDLIDYSTENFDRVVIDVPPSLHIPDALIAAKHFHSSVLVCGAGMADKKSIKIVKEKFESVHQNLIGVVVNRANYEKQDYYHKGYYKYYGKPRPASEFPVPAKRSD